MVSMKFQQGDVIISGPYLIQTDGKAIKPEKQEVQAQKLASISQVRGSHMILAVVQEVVPQGIRVEARYLVWNTVVESVDSYSLSGITYLPTGSRDYEMTELLNREENDVNRITAWLQYEGQQTWIAKHQPEEQK